MIDTFLVTSLLLVNFNKKTYLSVCRILEMKLVFLVINKTVFS